MLRYLLGQAITEFISIVFDIGTVVVHPCDAVFPDTGQHYIGPTNARSVGHAIGKLSYIESGRALKGFGDLVHLASLKFTLVGLGDFIITGQFGG